MVLQDSLQGYFVVTKQVKIGLSKKRLRWKRETRMALFIKETNMSMFLYGVFKVAYDISTLIVRMMNK